MNISFRKSLPEYNLEKYCDLYTRCFKKNEFKIEYLDWLYNKNPDGKYVGIDCFDGKKLIGQVGGIPYKFFWEDKKLIILISINVCVDEDYRGKSLFNKMAIEFEKYAKENNYDGIIAIGNKSATPAWIKSIRLINLGELDTFLGVGEIKKENLNKKQFYFYSSWDSEKLNWRINNPRNKTFIIKDNKEIKSIYAITKYPLIQAYAPLIFYDNKIQINSVNKRKIYPFIFLGKILNLKNKNIIKIPKILKPSPLNFLYKFFNIEKNLEKNKIFFTFLDFDIF